MLFRMDMRDVLTSARSARRPTPNISDEEAKSTIRITVNNDITDDDINYFVETLIQVLNII